MTIGHVMQRMCAMPSRRRRTSWRDGRPSGERRRARLSRGGAGRCPAKRPGRACWQRGRPRRRSRDDIRRRWREEQRQCVGARGGAERDLGMIVVRRIVQSGEHSWGARAVVLGGSVMMALRFRLRRIGTRLPLQRDVCMAVCVAVCVAVCERDARRRDAHQRRSEQHSDSGECSRVHLRNVLPHEIKGKSSCRPSNSIRGARIAASVGATRAAPRCWWAWCRKVTRIETAGVPRRETVTHVLRRRAWQWSATSTSTAVRDCWPSTWPSRSCSARASMR